MKIQQNKNAVDVSSTYRKDLHYINIPVGNGIRKETVVSWWAFYMTWLAWFLTRRSYRKFKTVNVLYQE